MDVHASLNTNGNARAKMDRQGNINMSIITGMKKSLNVNLNKNVNN